MSEAVGPQDEAASPVIDERLLGNERFVRYCWAKFLSLLGQNALIYGLFIDVISQQESSLATSAFVLASVIPSIILSVPGGMLADALPKKFVLIVTLMARMTVAYWFIYFDPGLGTVIGLTFLVWTAYQFFSPAENAAVLAIVPRERLAPASSILQALSLVGQLAGAGLVAPLAVTLIGGASLYIIVLVILGISGFIFATIPDLSPITIRKAASRTVWWKAMPAGFRIITGDNRLATVTFIRVLQDTGMMMFIVAAPVFIEDTLNTSAANAIYIAIPGALGLAAGLILAPALLKLVNARALVLAGFTLFVSVLLLLPFVNTIGADLSRVLGPFRALTDAVNLSDAIVATMILLPIAGLGASLVQVSARTEVYRRAPAASIAQVFATQSALGSIAALVPTFLAGLMLDLLPVQAVLVLMGCSLTLIALTIWMRRSDLNTEAERPT
jgi:MFS family permease